MKKITYSTILLQTLLAAKGTPENESRLNIRSLGLAKISGAKQFKATSQATKAPGGFSSPTGVGVTGITTGLGQVAGRAF